MSAVVSAPVRQANWERAGGRCEYCLMHEDDGTLPHQPDHIIAAQHGGEPVLENLALACCRCNWLKGPNLASVDPVTRERAWVFNPRRHRWADHFKLDGGKIIGVTAIGRATVFLLQFNLPDRVRLRRELQRNGRYPRAEQRGEIPLPSQPT